MSQKPKVNHYALVEFLQGENSSLKKELQQAYDEINELEGLVLTDALTGLPNRGALNAELERAVAYAARGRKKNPVSVVMLDIDHFKRVNDTYGHCVGDKFLKKLAKILQAEVRTEDFCARYGGEEFTIILRGTTLEQALPLIERLRKRIEKKLFLKVTTRRVHVTASFGIAQLQRGKSARRLLKRADDALYSAKHRGRNGVACAG